MKPEIAARFTPQILSDLAARYRVQADELTTLDGFESFIYQFEKDSCGYILRVGHSGRRGESLVRGEVDWLNYLSKGGASVASARHSGNNRLVETVPDGQGESFIATTFNLVSGTPPWEFGWSPALYVSYGKAIGKMHALTARYQPTDPLGYRPNWDDPSILDVEENLSNRDPVAWGYFDELVNQCRSLPRELDGYGLIHFDAHGLNFLVQSEDVLTFFDFDDCNYNWFAYDIAIILFYMAMWEKDKPAFTRSFLEKFFEGYRQESFLDPDWLETIPMFLKMREIDLYGVIQRDFDLDHLDDPWVAGFMDDRRRLIHERIPYVDLDFNTLSACLRS